MKRITRILEWLGSICLCLLFAARADAFNDPDYKNTDLPFEQRVADLMKRMTLEEKATQIQSFNPPINRPDLTLPATSWYTEAGHGVYPGRERNFAPRSAATSFPVPLSMAASWDPPLLKRVADAIGDEARVRMEPTGAKWKGIILFSPMINLARDPRWGRTQECYGEDPFLTSKMGVAFIQGVQGDDPKYIKTAAIVKHFAMNSQEAGRLTRSFDVSQRALREYYLPAFQTCLSEGKASATMSAYNGINKVPCAINSWLLTDILRSEWHFSGPVITDYRAVGYLKNAIRYPGLDTDAKAVAAALNAGVDVIADERPGGWEDAIVEAVQTGLVKEEVVDRALSRDLMLRMRLGFFDSPDKAPFARIPESVVGSREHLDLARSIAGEGIVLLKNDPMPKGFGFEKLLPLDTRRIGSIAVVGPYANALQYGDYSPPPAGKALSPREAIAAAVGDRIIVRGAQSSDIQESARVAASCDMAIVVIGLAPNMEHESVDRPNIDLFEDGQQRLLPQGKWLDAIVKANPCTVVVLEGGGVIGLAWVKEHCPAIVMSWYPGEEGGVALAEMLLGQTNPAGRLPLTFYRSASDLPPMDDYEISKGRTYMYLPPSKAAVYPFGHGLSYTQFSYSHLSIEPPANGDRKTFLVSVEVTNTGVRDGDEVAQLYIRKTHSTIARPIKQLKGFERIALPKGQMRAVHFSLPASELAYWNERTNAFEIEPGEYEAMIGSSSEDIRLRGMMEIK